MNVLFHRAFDKLYLGISTDLRVIISDKLYDGLKGKDKDKTYEIFNPYNGKNIMLPKKFKPNIEFIEKQYTKFTNAR